MNAIKKVTKLVNSIENENGAIGYLLAWMMGIPASILLIIFLLRG